MFTVDVKQQSKKKKKKKKKVMLGEGLSLPAETCPSVFSTKAPFHITVITQINKSMVYFIVRRNAKFGCYECWWRCSNFDAKSGTKNLTL